MKKLPLILIAFLTLPVFVQAQQEAQTKTGKKVLLYANGTWAYADSLPGATGMGRMEIPRGHANEEMLEHTGYAFSYNEEHEQANWVAYELTQTETNKVFERSDKFMPDPLVKTGTANDKDYAGSGYDRGHLAPAADMGWSEVCMAESFYYSNMSPQVPAFNRGIWKKLEELVREWAIENRSVYVVTGPVLTAGLPVIGPNKVSVPQYFYKVVLDYTIPDIKGIGFIMPNAGSGESLEYFAVSIDSVEQLTGIDFFSLLPDEEEEWIEKTVCLSCWSWGEKKAMDVNTGGNNDKPQTGTTSVQCVGTTKSGKRCKNMTKSSSGRCFQHGGS